MRAQEIDEIIATALERVHGKRPRIVRGNGSQFVAKEWREVILRWKRFLSGRGILNPTEELSGITVA